MTGSMSKPIHILGGGPSGLGAAIILAKAGKEVHLHERYDRVGKRFQGDLQGLENWSTHSNVLDELRSFGLDTDFAATPFNEVILSDGKKSIQKSSKEPIFYLVKRGPFADSLDTALCQQACNHGVQIHYRSSCPHSLADIIATGPIRQSIIAADKGLVFSTNLPNIAIGLFHDEIAYLGYSYLLIANGYGCLCTVVFKDLHRLNTCFERTVEVARRLVPINLDNARPVGGVGSFSYGHPLKIGKALLIGESAGFQDLLWGFGIRTALTSAHLATQELLTGADYSSLVNTNLQPSLKASIVNRYLWEKFKWNKRTLLPSLLQLTSSPRTSFRWLYRYSPIHKLLYSTARRYVEKHYPASVQRDLRDQSD